MVSPHIRSSWHNMHQPLLRLSILHGKFIEASGRCPSLRDHILTSSWISPEGTPRYFIFTVTTPWVTIKIICATLLKYNNIPIWLRILHSFLMHSWCLCDNQGIFHAWKLPNRAFVWITGGVQLKILAICMQRQSCNVCASWCWFSSFSHT